MIVKMHISRIETGAYEVCMEDGGVEITGQAVYASVSDAIFETGSNVPYEIASFVHIYYGALSCGTESVHRMKTQATIIADEIMELCAAVHRDKEQRNPLR
jgi:hypothetical protein